VNDAELDKYRMAMEKRINDLTLEHIAHSKDIEYIKINSDKVISLLEKQNGRVRKNTNAIAWISGLGSAVSVLYAGLIAWIFRGGFK